jgi:hypothetical protein
MTGDRGLKPGHWLFIGLAVLIVAAGAYVVVRRGDPAAQSADPPASSPASSPVGAPPIDRPECVPRIKETEVHGPQYAFVFASSCDRVARELRFRVTALDAAGATLNEAGDVISAGGGVLFPGAELAVTDEWNPAPSVKISGIHVEVIHLVSQPLSDFSAWGHAQVAGLRRGPADRLGTFDLTGTLQGAPPLCVSQFVAVLRDSAGTIIYTQARTVIDAGDPVTFSVPPQPKLDLARSTIYAPQLPATQFAPTAGVTCDGRKGKG